MAQTIKLKRSSTAGNVPSTADLSLGEIAINTADGAVYIKKNDGSDSIVAIHDDDVLKIDTGNSRIGIGTTSPVRKLHLHEASSSLNYMKFSNTTTGTTGTDGFEIGINSDEHAVIYQRENLDIKFRTNNTDRVIFKGGGNVGIGTTSPDTTLDVNGDITMTANIVHKGDSNTYFGFHGNDLWRVVTGGQERFEISTSGFRFNEHGHDMDFTIESNNNANMFFVDGGNDRVGIGTSTPSRQLTVYNTSAAAVLAVTTSTSNLAQIALGDTDDDNYAQIILENSTNKLQIQNGGGGAVSDRGITLDSSENVGIGTESPNQKLVVVDNSGETTLAIDNATTTTGNHVRLDFRHNGITGSQIKSENIEDFTTTANRTSDLQFYTRNNGTIAERLRIKEDGNVGIGTTSPATKLEVAGNITLPSDGQIKFRGTNHYPRIYASSNDLKINVDNGSGSNFEALGIDNATGAITFKQAYTFPTADGSANQVLQTDGSGNLSFASVSGSGVTISNNVNNRVLTGDGTNANAEANLTFDGSTLALTGNQTVTGGITVGDSSADVLRFVGLLKQGSGSGTTVIDDSLNLTNIAKADFTAKQYNEVKRPDYDASATNTRIANVSTDKYIANVPFGDAWHDIFAHRRHYTWTYETSTDGTNFTSATINDNIFDHRDESYYEALGSSIKAVRWTVTNVQHANLQYISLSQQYTASTPQTTLTVENGDGTTYSTVMAETTFQGSQKTHFFALDTSVNNTHIRITLKKATISDTNAVEISRLCAWTARSGDQGRGKELHLPFDYSLRDQITLKDSQELRFGNSSDLVIEHNATNSTITNNTGNISINNNTDDGDIILSTDNGSGGIVEYLRFDGSHTRMTANKNLLFFDNIKADFGTGSDLRIWHDGTNSNISNGTGDLIIENSADDKDIIFKSDDGSGGVTSYITIDGSASLTKFDVNTKHLDNVKATFGDSADLEIYHTGNHSYITDTGTGNLYIRADSLDLRRYANGEQYLTGDANGAVTIFYDGVAKLATKSDGVDITGELQSDSLDVDGAGDISGNLTVGGNTTITGNLTVNGTTVTNSATNTTIEDALIELGSGNTGANSNDLGLILERGTTGNNIFIGWDESEDKVAFGTTTATGSSTGNISYSRADILASSLDLANHIDIADSGKIRLGNSDDMQLYHNGTDSYIVNNTGTLVIDAAGDILADVDGGDVVIRDGGAEFARIKNSSTNFGLQAAQQDKDIVFLGNDGGSAITALTLDMSDAGAATFNHTISSGKVTADTGEATAIPLQIGSSSSTSYTLQRWITSAHSGTEAYIIAYGASNASQANHFAMKNIATGGEIFFELASGVEPLRLTSTEATFSGNVVLGDSDILKLGTGLDLQIYHNGTNSFINNDTGDLFIKNFANDEDIVFQCDDGSGGVATYFQLDGSQAQSRFLRNVKWDDSIQAIFGGSDDLTIQHNGTDSKITNNTGNLEIRNNTNDGDIIFQSDDGSGGITEYFRLDGGTERIEASKSFRFADSVRAQFGASSDLQIYHDGSHTYINNGTGHVYFQQSADDMDIVFQCDDGSGGVTAYMQFDGSATEIDILQHVKIPDGKAIYFGTGNDLNIFHNGSHSYVDHIGTGNLYIRNTTNDADISFQSDDGSGGITEYFRVDGGLGYNVSPKHILFNDNAKARFGDAGDLDIYHNGSHSNIQDTGTGNLRIAGSIVEITKNDFTETMAKFTQDGAAELYHNNSKKFETTSGGVTVTGNVTHSGLTMTSGTDIDQLTTTTVTATLSTSWQDTGIDGTDLQTGTYIVQVFVDDHSVGGNHYDEYYSGIMSWTSASTNSTVTDEILLHRAGHAPNSGDFFLRTQRAANTDTHDLMLQMRGATSNTGNSDYIFKFRRMI